MMYINYWAVLVSAIASMAIGSLWYGPLFGKQFMPAMLQMKKIEIAELKKAYEQE